MSDDIRIDLYSDTQTRPTPGMREAMARAEVGDEQRGEDPTTNRLCAMVAELLGKEAAVFLPSGTLCNQIAILVQCRHGDEILCDRTAHIITSESGGLAIFAGAMTNPIDGARGMFTGDQLAAQIRPHKRNTPRSRMVVVENTSNKGGGSIWPVAQIRDVARVVRENGLVLHMDGARLLNAVVASGTSARDFAEPFDSLWLDLSKGLGCPVGGVLAGSRDFIDQAWTWKTRMGAAMRQSGMIAAAGIYALENHVARLAEDNEHARMFAEAIADLPGIAIDPAEVETNLVFFDVADTGLSAQEFGKRLEARGVRVGAQGPSTIRAVTHLDVNRQQVAEAAEAVRETVLALAG